MTVVNHFEPQDCNQYTVLLEVVTTLRVDYHLHSAELYEKELRNPQVKMVNLVYFRDRGVL